MARRILITTGLTAIAAGAAGCFMPANAPIFDAASMQRAERETARLDEPQPMGPLPTTQEDPFGGPGSVAAGTTRPAVVAGASPTTGPSFGSNDEPILRLSLQECVQRAVLYNHDVRVAGYQPAIDATRVTEAEALFDPVFFTKIQAQRKDDETAGTIYFNPRTQLNNNTPSFQDKQDIYSIQTGIKQTLESGTQVQLDYESSYNELIPRRFFYNPYYENRINLQLTQPLLRDFGSSVNQARIVINRDTARESLLEFRKTLEDNIAKLEETYWQLVNAEQNVIVESTVLSENEASYRVDSDRLREHLITSLEVSQVQSALETRRATLIRARADARNLSDKLKQLMNDPNIPVSSPIVILPGDNPIVSPMAFDVDDLIASGMDNRFELGEQMLKIDAANVTYGVAQNNTLPKLDLTASVSPQVIASDYGHLLSRESQFPHWEYGAGINFEYPIGNREALAILRRTALQRDQAVEQYAALVSQVALEVRQAAREVDTNYQLMVRERQARFASQRALSDVIQRQGSGAEALTPEFVQLRLNLADQVAISREAENQAVSNYNVALEKLERAKGTLLRYNNVVMQEDPYKNQGQLR